MCPLITEMDNFDKYIFQYTIHSVSAQEGTVSPVAELLVKLKESLDIKANCSSLLRIVGNLCFMWKNTRMNRRVLSEGYDL
jgi:hypothetical protein